MRIHQGITSWLSVAWFWLRSLFEPIVDASEPPKTYPVYDQDGRYICHLEAGRVLEYLTIARREDGDHEIREARAVPEGPFKSDNGEYMTIYRLKSEVGPGAGARFTP